MVTKVSQLISNSQLPLDFGPIVVKFWSDSGHIVSIFWSYSGQILVILAKFV